METPGHIRSQRLLGGHPALDFVNSAHGEGGPDLVECLRTYEDLVAWAHHAGLISAVVAGRLTEQASARPGEANEIHGLALFVRGELDRLFRAVAVGATPPADAARSLAAAHARAVAHAVLTPNGGRLVWSWPDAADLGAPLWPVVHAGVELATSGELARVKVCDGCPWLFFDASRNRSRRWCAMDDGCGGAAKMKSYVARRAARQGTTA